MFTKCLLSIYNMPKAVLPTVESRAPEDEPACPGGGGQGGCKPSGRTEATFITQTVSVSSQALSAPTTNARVSADGCAWQGAEQGPRASGSWRGWQSQT